MGKGGGEVIQSNYSSYLPFLPPHTHTPHSLSLPISHNDLAYEIRSHFLNQLDQVDLNTSTDVYGNQWQTDIPRLRAGRVGAQVSNLN